MKRILNTLFFLFLAICAIAQKTSKHYAIVEFVGEKSENTTTYLGKIKKGDLNSLQAYLSEQEKKDINLSNISSAESFEEKRNNNYLNSLAVGKRKKNLQKRIGTRTNHSMKERTVRNTLKSITKSSRKRKSKRIVRRSRLKK